MVLGAGDGTEEETEQRRQSQEQEEKTKETTGNIGERVWRVVNIAACFFIACSSFIYVFANINPYMTSYLRNVTHGSVDYTDTLWVDQSGVIAACVAMPFLGMLSRRIPTQVILLLGIMLNAVYLIGTYWTLRISLWATIVTYGICGGLCLAVYYPMMLKLGAQWAGPGQKGFVTGIILMGFGAGPLAWNPLTTWYVNPDNLEPASFGDDRYYTQSVVLDKVPGMFLLVGGLSTGIQVLCLLVIRNPPLPQTAFGVSCSGAEERESASRERDPRLSQSRGETETSIREKQSQLTDTAQNAVRVADTGYDNADYNWKQVLRSRAFWTLWLVILCTNFALAFCLNLYKAYGQTFIKDDHFLAAVATLTSVINAVGRVLWGLLADRIRPRMILLAAQSFLAILVVTFMTCEETGRVAYLLWVCAMFLSVSAFYTTLPLLTLSLFGSRNYSVNTGLLYTSGIFGALLPSLIAPALKNAFSWNGLFFLGFATLFLGVCLNLSLDWCQCGNSIPQEMLPKLSIKRRRRSDQSVLVNT